jgi:hypothetical protein
LISFILLFLLCTLSQTNNPKRVSMDSIDGTNQPNLNLNFMIPFKCKVRKWDCRARHACPYRFSYIHWEVVYIV